MSDERMLHEREPMEHLFGLLDSLAEEIERSESQARGVGKGGMRVPPTADFWRWFPSNGFSQLRWWARELRRAAERVRDERGQAAP